MSNENGALLRYIEETPRETLQPGKLGVVMAPAGVGKTACLVQLGIDHIQRGQDVLHVALGRALDDIESRYNVRLDDLLSDSPFHERDVRRAEMTRRRLIQTYHDERLEPGRLQELLSLMSEHLQLSPAVILVDGYAWNDGVMETRKELSELKDVARDSGATFWMTARTKRGPSGETPQKLPRTCAEYADLIDTALLLEPKGEGIELRVLYEGTAAEPRSSTLSIDLCGNRPTESRPQRHTLLSGGAAGAEAEFGSCAEAWGVQEINFSYPGRQVARRRGLVELDAAQLDQGDVSWAYVTTRMNRTYSSNQGLRKVLQTIWHQVHTAGEVFVVGSLQQDATVKGGTGWAAELARHWKKELYVFDQEQDAWFTWRSDRWREVKNVTISSERFTGTGTRNLTERGRRAIQELFLVSFGDSVE